jgi:hypothetical protein
VYSFLYSPFRFLFVFSAEVTRARVFSALRPAPDQVASEGYEFPASYAGSWTELHESFRGGLSVLSLITSRKYLDFSYIEYYIHYFVSFRFFFLEVSTFFLYTYLSLLISCFSRFHPILLEGAASRGTVQKKKYLRLFRTVVRKAFSRGVAIST